MNKERQKLTPGDHVKVSIMRDIFDNLKLTKQVSLPIFHQELIYIWNGFKVLGHRPDLVEPLMNLVDNSLHKLHKAKGEDYFDVMSVHREESHKKF